MITDLQVHVQLSHPVEMDIVLRKRICVSVYKQKGLAAAFRRKMHGNVSISINHYLLTVLCNFLFSFQPFLSSCVVYEVISNVPLATSDGEDHEALAMLAASGANVSFDRRTPDIILLLYL